HHRFVEALAEDALGLGRRRDELQRLQLAYFRQNLNDPGQDARSKFRPLVVGAVLLLKLGFAFLIDVVTPPNAPVHLAQFVPVGAPGRPAGQRNKIAHGKAVRANSQVPI
nr:hypothetical protein [Tanacetum cinerariifolium]